MVTAIVTSKGQIVIPAEIRRKHGIKKGATLSVVEKGDQIILQPLDTDYFEKMAGILGTKGKLTKALLRERMKDKKREEKRQ